MVTDAMGAFPGAKSIPGALVPALLGGSSLLVVALLFLYKLSAQVGARALARALGLSSLARAVEHDRLVNAIDASAQALERVAVTAIHSDKEAAQPGAAADAPQAARR